VTIGRQTHRLERILTAWVISHLCWAKTTALAAKLSHFRLPPGREVSFASPHGKGVALHAKSYLSTAATFDFKNQSLPKDGDVLIERSFDGICTIMFACSMARRKAL